MTHVYRDVIFYVLCLSLLVLHMKCKDEYSHFSLLTFHNVSLQYVINFFLHSQSATGPIPMYDSIRDKKKSKHDYLTSYWSIDLCLIASFYAEIEGYCRHYHFCEFAN